MTHQVKSNKLVMTHQIQRDEQGRKHHVHKSRTILKYNQVLLIWQLTETPACDKAHSQLDSISIHSEVLTSVFAGLTDDTFHLVLPQSCHRC